MSTPSPGPQRRPGRTDITRGRLFDACMLLIGERGPGDVTVDEIAAAAGVSKGTVYYNFGSKADLITQLLEYGVDRMETRLAVGRDLEDPLEALETMVGAAVDFLHEYPSFAQLWMAEMWRTPSDWHVTLLALRHRLTGLILAAVEKVSARYPVDAAVPAAGVATAIFGASFVVALDRRTFHPERTRAEAVNAIMTIMRGYLARPDAPAG